MNYRETYKRLIERARWRDYRTIEGEWHHSFPKCMGGTDTRSKGPGAPGNCVKLTYDEHIFAHRLLTRIYPWIVGLARAVFHLVGKNKGKTARRTYAMDRARLRKIASLYKPTPESNRRRSQALRGRRFSAARKRNISASTRGLRKTAAARANASAAQKKRFENPEAREKARAAAIRRWSDPEERERQSERKKKHFESPEAREKNRQAQRSRWTPELRALHAEKTKAGMAAAKNNRSIETT